MYHHEDNDAFRYLGEDDGGTLTLAVTRAREGDQGPLDGGASVSIVLRRTPSGFVGETRSTTFTQAGTACPVSFPTEATKCDEEGLSLRAVASSAIDEQCHPATSGPKPVWKEQRLVRGEPRAPDTDAGEPPFEDAGTRPAN
jgi:hypothetical protein